MPDIIGGYQSGELPEFHQPITEQGELPRNVDTAIWNAVEKKLSSFGLTGNDAREFEKTWMARGKEIYFQSMKLGPNELDEEKMAINLELTTAALDHKMDEESHKVLYDSGKFNKFGEPNELPRTEN